VDCDGRLLLSPDDRSGWLHLCRRPPVGLSWAYSAVAKYASDGALQWRSTPPLWASRPSMHRVTSTLRGTSSAVRQLDYLTINYDSSGTSNGSPSSRLPRCRSQLHRSGRSRECTSLVRGDSHVQPGGEQQWVAYGRRYRWAEKRAGHRLRPGTGVYVAGATSSGRSLRYGGLPVWATGNPDWTARTTILG
jgi:hypothetical protein